VSVLIGLLGGAFDPVHRGHLHIAQTLVSELPFLQLRFLPCYRPSHRYPLVALPQQRLTMLKLALTDVKHPRLSIDTQEIDRQGISYTVDTLQVIREQDTDSPYAVVMSSEAWSNFHTWRLWQRILSLAHLIIVDRPNHVFSSLSMPPVLTELAERCQTDDPHDLLRQPAGRLFYYPMPAGLDISATAIRQDVWADPVSREQALSRLMPSVADYVVKNSLYKNISCN